MIEITVEQARELGLDVKPGETVKVKVKPERPTWADCRAVVDPDGDVWSRASNGVSFSSYYACFDTRTLAGMFPGRPFRPLIAADGTVLLTDDEIDAVEQKLRDQGYAVGGWAVSGFLCELHGIPEHGVGDPR